MQLKLSAALSAALLLFSFNIHSDDHMSSNPVFVPVEIQQCKFANNKDITLTYDLKMCNLMI